MEIIEFPKIITRRRFQVTPAASAIQSNPAQNPKFPCLPPADGFPSPPSLAFSSPAAIMLLISNHISTRPLAITMPRTRLQRNPHWQTKENGRFKHKKNHLFNRMAFFKQ
jgi:hypothetical protein